MSIRTLAWVVTILLRPLAMTQSSGPDGVAACGDQLVVPVTIVDKESSVLMHDLTPGAFHIRINGHEISPVGVTLPTEPPRFVLLIDTSGSMYDSDSKWRLTRAIAEQAARTAASDSKISVFTFTEQIAPIPRTAPENIIQDIQRAFPGKAPPKARTSLFDAVAQGAAAIEDPRPGDTILVITDGGDNRSKSSARHIESSLVSRGIRLSSILLLGGTQTPEERIGEEMLAELVDRTGGMSMSIGASGTTYASFGGPSFENSRKHLPKVLANVSGMVATLIRSQSLEIQRPPAMKRRDLKLEYRSPQGGKVEMYYPKFVYPCGQ